MQAIAAMDLNRGIGYKGTIPWKLSADMKFFKEMTSGRDQGGFLAMGRNTFKSVGDLPKRFTYVVTHDTNAHDPEFCFWDEVKHTYVTLEQLLSIIAKDDDVNRRMWVCGGAQIYNLLLPYCNELWLTIILDEFEVDTYMPEFDQLFPYSEIKVQEKDYWIVLYSKTNL
jgi:dihydrofolate reductase